MKLKKIAATLLAASTLASSALAGCSGTVNANASAATLDGKEISMGVANFVAQVQAVQMDSYLLSYYGEDMWDSDAGEDGMTMTESVKKSVMEQLQEYYLLDAHTSDYGIELTEDEKAAITQAASKFLSDNSEKALGVMGATQDTVEEMLRLHKVQSKMRAAIEKEIDTNVSDEECAQKTFRYVRFQKQEEGASATDDTTADEAGTGDQKEDALAFLEAAADGMEEAAKEKEYTVQTCSYGEGDLNEDDNTTSMDVSVLQAADKLKDGELASALAETDSAYYVVQMDSTDDKTAAETKKESILSQRRSDKYDEVLKGYQDACEWKVNEGEWGKVNFDELYTVKQPETATDDGAGDAGTAADDGAGDAGTAADGAGDAGTAADGADAGTAAGDGAGNADTTAGDGAENGGKTTAEE